MLPCNESVIICLIMLFATLQRFSSFSGARCALHVLFQLLLSASICFCAESTLQLGGPYNGRPINLRSAHVPLTAHAMNCSSWSPDQCLMELLHKQLKMLLLLQEEPVTSYTNYNNKTFESSQRQGDVASFDPAATASHSASSTANCQIPDDPEWNTHQTYGNGLFSPNDRITAWDQSQPSTTALGFRESTSEAESPQTATLTDISDTERVPNQQTLRHHLVTHDIAEADALSATHPMRVPSQTPIHDYPTELVPHIKHGEGTVPVRKAVHRIMGDFTLCHDADDCIESLKVCALL